MAFAVTARSQVGTGGTSVATATSGSFTPSADSLLLAFGTSAGDQAVMSQALPDAPFTGTGGLSWTEQESYELTDAPVFNSSTGFRLNSAFGYAPVGASPAAQTVTFDAFASINGYYSLALLDVTGHDTASPIVQSTKSAATKPNGNAESHTITLPGTAVVGNLVVVSFGVTADAGGAFAAPTYGGQAMTQVYNQNALPVQNGVWYRIVTGAEASNTITCTDLGNLVGNVTAFAVEIAAAPSATAPGQVTGLTVTSQRFHAASLTWNAPGDGGSAITDYLIEVAPDSAGSPGTWVTVSDPVQTTTNHLHTNTAAGLKWYRVSAINAIGTGASSTPVQTFVRGTTAAGVKTVNNARGQSMTYSTPLVENDLIVIWFSITDTVSKITLPDGWKNVLGGGTVVRTGLHTMCCVYHRVTAAEAGSSALSCDNLWDTNVFGSSIDARIVGVDPTTAVMGVGSVLDSNELATPHVLSGVLDTQVPLSNGYVLSCVAAASSQTYTLPSGWTAIATQANGLWSGRRNALTTANTAVSATNITPSAADAYISITVVFVNSELPGAITDLDATPAPTAVDLTWSAPADNGSPITDYKIQYRSVP